MTAARGHDGVMPVLDSRQAWREAVRAGLVTRQQAPLNAELPPAALGGELTPAAQFFRRNHFPMPDLAQQGWRLRVGGLVREPLALSLAELTRLGRQSAVVTLECAGNGRALFRPPVDGEPWELGAVGSARWTGVPLADILELAGVAPQAREVIFRGADVGRLDEVDEPVRFERSLPVADALAAGPLLAYEMNGEPLPARHGFPLRLVVPGWYAVASVKWLTDIELTSEPFAGYFQDTHYVYEWQRDGRREREPVGLARVRALVTDPAGGSRAPRGPLSIRGVAWSGAGPIARVQVDTGNGRWRRARLAGVPERYGWQPWELTARLPPGTHRIRARAFDAAGHGQPAEPEWNALGYGGNFVHEVSVTIG